MSDISRRTTLKLGPGLIAVGTGLVAALSPSDGLAEGKRFELHFFSTDGDTKTKLGSIPLPPAVVAAIEAGHAPEIEFVWHVKRGKSKKRVARHAAPGADSIGKKP
jgi:hypothetical protein